MQQKTTARCQEVSRCPRWGALSFPPKTRGSLSNPSQPGQPALNEIQTTRGMFAQTLCEGIGPLHTPAPRSHSETSAFNFGLPLVHKPFQGASSVDTADTPTKECNDLCGGGLHSSNQAGLCNNCCCTTHCQDHNSTSWLRPNNRKLYATCHPVWPFLVSVFTDMSLPSSAAYDCLQEGSHTERRDPCKLLGHPGQGPLKFGKRSETKILNQPCSDGDYFNIQFVFILDLLLNDIHAIFNWGKNKCA